MATRSPRPAPIGLRPGELPEELALRRIVAKMRLKAVKAALSTHAAADTGRRNRDWKANNSSADLAVIPDSLTLIGRARQLVRDTWTGKSLVRAFCRNVVGRQITVTPHAKDVDGKPLTALNLRAQAEWTRWCKSKKSDVERKQTFGQKQRLAAKEYFTAGEHAWMWVYRPVNRTEPVGLQFQGFEPEQFDLRILSFQGREVRGGVEVDENGAPLAYHLYTRNPNDVLYRHAFFSERVPASRMFHYFEGERVLQTRGVSKMTPVMQDMRDIQRGNGAVLTRFIMEAAVGMVIKTDLPVPNQNTGLMQSTVSPAAGDTGQTDSGLTTADYVPGMVANLRPGESIEFINPTTPGNTYEPFINLTARGIGAGTGMSRGQITRQSDGNYSSARQDMLEDRKEWELEHELIIDDLIRPAYELWFDLAVLEGRFDDVAGFDVDEYHAERHRFVEADYIPPPQTWIDPEKEANAFGILLKNRLITREEIVAMRGQRFYQIVQKLSVERKTCEDLDLSLPENDEDRKELRDLIKTWYASRLGVLDNAAANATDLESLIEKSGLPTRKFTQTDLPITAPAPPPPPVAPAGGVKPPAGANGTSANGKANGNALATIGNAPNVDMKLPLPVLTVPPEVPNFHEATDPVLSCSTCSFILGNQCTRFNFITAGDKACGDWIAQSLTDNIGNQTGAKTFPPGPQPGQRPLDRRFFPDADPTPRS